MITLYGFAPSFGLPDLSPFVLKAATYMRMAGIEYRMAQGDIRKAPKGKLPYIEDAGQVIADSSFLVDHCRQKYQDLDQGCSAHDRAAAVAFKALLEEHFYFVLLSMRWKDDRGWVVLKPNLQQHLRNSGVPGLVAPMVTKIIRKQVLKNAYFQGTGRHTIAEAEQLGLSHLTAVSDWLGDQPYFLGDRPRSIDATVFGFIWSILTPPFEGVVKEGLKSKQNLVDYCNRLRAQYWKE